MINLWGKAVGHQRRGDGSCVGVGRRRPESCRDRGD